jgi:hypothetical protein
MVAWAQFKRHHGYHHDDYWFGERPRRGSKIVRMFACLSCLVGGSGSFRKRGGRANATNCNSSNMECWERFDLGGYNDRKIPSNSRFS